MNDLDAMLARLAAEPVPAALDGIEAAVWARATMRRPSAVSHAMLSMAAFLALATGLAGGLWTAETAHGPDALAPLGGASPFAPSSLLAHPQ